MREFQPLIDVLPVDFWAAVRCAAFPGRWDFPPLLMRFTFFLFSLIET